MRGTLGAGGSFTFDVGGTGSIAGEWGSLNLQVDSTEADAELSYEDPQCGELVDILGEFLRMLPTITNGFPQGFRVDVVGGVGTLVVPQDPYALEITVTLLAD